MAAMSRWRPLSSLIAAVIGLLSVPAHAGSGGNLRIAVAANFAPTLEQLAEAFRRETPAAIPVTLVPGSTGKHYAQIRHGAPFDAFFAADAARPERLEREGRIVPGSRFTYALGCLVLWSPDPDRVDADGRVLAGDGFRRLAIANPRLAPYGRAAREVLEGLDLWARLQPRLVRGENIAQAFQYVASGNAELGFVACSQVIGRAGSRWPPDPARHAPIVQQAVLLRDSPAARAFLDFVRSPAARARIRAAGYGLP